MLDNIACPSCRRRLVLPPEVEGKNVQCPSCHTIFVAGGGLVGDADSLASHVEEPAAPAEHIRQDPPGQGPPEREAAPVRWPRPVAERPARRSPALWIALSCLGICALVGVVVLIVNIANRRPAEIPPLAREDDEARRQEIMQAFRNQKPL